MTPAWSGRKVTEARAFIAARLPMQCGRCPKMVEPGQAFVVGHIKSRAAYPELTWSPSNWRAEHKGCSEGTGQAAVIEKARLEGARGVFSRSDDVEQPPPLPVSLPDDPQTVPDALSWASHVHDAPPWLSPYLDVPEDATPPTAMTPVHPDAVGSYGPALLAWAAAEHKVTPRWWQALVIVRILEHRADGTLCWPEVVMSCSRRSGKSVVVRLLALWRLVFAPDLFGEQQLIVHSASTLKIAKEPMRYAARWVEQQDHLKVVRNNNSPGIEDTQGDHRWLVVPSDKTAGLDTCMGVLDEAWFIKPEVVDDDLEPSLLERVSPQLLLISTAHRRATSLMRTRIARALAMEEPERVLLLLWCAMPSDAVDDPKTWRKASAHWTSERAEYVARKYAKAAAGEVDLEADDLNPMAGFEAQYLNRWRLKERPLRGEPAVSEDAWAALVDVPPVELPVAAAIESWFDKGASLALAWPGAEGKTIVSASDHGDLAAAVAELRESGFTGYVTVGASLMDDPALKGVRKRKGQGRAGAVAGELSRLMTEDALRHDGGDHLTEQALGLRVTPGADGPRMVSSGRSDAVKAAVWAVNRARLPSSGKPRILTAS